MSVRVCVCVVLVGLGLGGVAVFAVDRGDCALPRVSTATLTRNVVSTLPFRAVRHWGEKGDAR